MEDRTHKLTTGGHPIMTCFLLHSVLIIKGALRSGQPRGPERLVVKPSNSLRVPFLF